jgi:hypothetical protein
VMAVARECKLHIAFELNRNDLSHVDEIDDEEKLIILNRALMHHEIFIDRVRPELDNDSSLTASAVFKVDDEEPGWRLEPMP